VVVWRGKKGGKKGYIGWLETLSGCNFGCSKLVVAERLYFVHTLLYTMTVF
jgi:hypothetical protein